MRIVVVLALSLILGASCTKDRPVEFEQNQGLHLMSVDAFDGYEFEVTAGEAVSSSSTSSSAEVDSDSDVFIPILNSFPLVTYTTKGDTFNLMRDIPFRGRPGVKYKFKYRLHDTNKDGTDGKIIMAYQIAKAEDIPGHLFTSAVKVEGSDLYEVPYSYKSISTHKVELREDRNKEETRTLGEFAAETLSEASHFRVSNAAPALYEAESKVDILPADLFEGEWFYAVTLTKTTIEKSGSVGSLYAQDYNFSSASRVRFVQRKNRIRAVNINVDEGIDTSDDMNLTSVIEFPINRLDYRQKQNSTGAGKMEEKVDTTTKGAPHWSKLRYVNIDFTDAKTPRISAEGSELHHFEIAKDYLSFDLEFPTQNVRLKFAFKRAHKSKKGIGYPKADRKIYGFFTAQKTYINNYKIEREGDYEKNIFLSRYYPDNGKIEFYLSDLTPNSFLPVAREAVRQWDDAFSRAGTGIRIALNESKKVAVGDIRYNIINIIRNTDTDGGGYGPQLADFNSGEIISATSNVNTGYHMNQLIESIRNYIRSKNGMFAEEWAGYAPEWGKFSIVDRSNGTIAANLPTAENFVARRDFILENDVDAKEAHIPNTARLFKASKLGSLIGQYRESNYIRTNDGGKIIIPPKYGTLSNSEQGKILDDYYRNLEKNRIVPGSTLTYSPFDGLSERKEHEQMIASSKRYLNIVKQYCEEDINAYVADIKVRGITHDSEKELKLVESCRDKAINEVVLGTVMHEMGHNFGLRHNFYAATDVKNFPEGFDTIKDFGLSSIMDYMGMAKTDRLGNYDVAAIRYGYARQAETKDGLIKLLPGMSIVESAGAQSQNFEQKYKYCTDEDIDIYTQMGAMHAPIDPLCARHQFGSTPLEVVRMATIDYEAYNAVYGKRLDRANGPAAGSMVRYFERFVGMPILKIYNQWRWHLRNFIKAMDATDTGIVTKIKKKSRSGYLEKLSEEEYNILIDAMRKDTGKHGKAFAEYYDAGRAAYSFFKSLLDIPSKYCAVKATADQVNYDLLSFYNIREKLYNDVNVEVQSCEDALDYGYFSELGLEYIGSLGEYNTPIMSSMDIINPDSNRVDILGYSYSSALVMSLLTVRSATSREMIIADFKPNFLDNPRYREELKAIVLTRMSEGVHSKTLESQYKVDPSALAKGDILEFAKQRDQRAAATLQAGRMQIDGLIAQAEQAKAGLKQIDELIKIQEAAAAAAANNADADANNADADADDNAAVVEEDNKIRVSLVIDGEQVTATIEKPEANDENVVAPDVPERPALPSLEQLTARKKQIEQALEQMNGQIKAMEGRFEAMQGQLVNDHNAAYLSHLQSRGIFYPFFAEKQYLLLGQFAQFVNGLAHPTDAKLTYERMEIFTTIKDPQEIRSIKAERAESEYAFVQYGARQYLAVKEDNEIMYNMIKQAEKLESVANDAVNGVDGAIYESDILPQALGIVLPTFAELAQIPFAQAQQSLQGRFMGLSQALRSSNLSEAEMNEVLELVISVVAPYNDALMFIGQNAAQLQANGAQSLLDVFMLSGMDEESIKAISKESIPTMIDLAKAELDVRRKAASEYNKKFEEFEAQRNILETVILKL
jgi:hypothetical protein